MLKRFLTSHFSQKMPKFLKTWTKTKEFLHTQNFSSSPLAFQHPKKSLSSLKNINQQNNQNIDINSHKLNINGINIYSSNYDNSLIPDYLENTYW